MIDFNSLPTFRDTVAAIDCGAFKLSAIRLTICTKSGGLYQFALYTYAPYFEPGMPRHYVSRCGRVRVFPRRVLVTSDAEKATIVKEQYEVFVNGKRVPDHQFSIRTTIKPKMYKPRPKLKTGNGRASADFITGGITR